MRRLVTFEQPILDAAIAGLVVASDAAFVRRVVRLVGEAEVQLSNAEHPAGRAAGIVQRCDDAGLAGLAHRRFLRVRDIGRPRRPESSADDRACREQEWSKQHHRRILIPGVGP